MPNAEFKITTNSEGSNCLTDLITLCNSMSVLDCAYLYTPLLGCGCYTSVCNVTGVSLNKGEQKGIQEGNNSWETGRHTCRLCLVDHPGL